jgi:hypothetical protein
VRIAQFYETTVFDLDTDRAISLIVVPSRVIVDRTVLENSDTVCEFLGCNPRYISRSPSSLTYMIASVLMEADAESALKRIVDLANVPSDRLWEKVGREVAEFAEQIAYAKLVPFEESPLNLHSLASLAGAGAKTGAVGIGFTIGLVAALHGTPLVLVTVPAGIVICGAAIGAAEGLKELLKRLIAGQRPKSPPKKKTPEEKIVVSVIPE